ncbi:MAG: hypothetical protein WAP74_03085 [Patescibacteria group bacterium]
MPVQKGFARIFLLIPVLIAIILIMGALVHGISKRFQFDDNPQVSKIFDISPLTDSLNYFNDVSKLSPCGDTREFFTTLPLALDDFRSIDPLGLLSPTAHVFPAPHLYFRIKLEQPNNFNSPVLKVPLYSPANLTITRINLIQATNKSEFADDAAVHFSPCAEFKAYFDHVVDLAPKLQKAYDESSTDRCDEYTLTYKTGPVNWKKCDKKVNLKISAGELIGYAGGGQGQAALDFAAFDKRIEPNIYANPKRDFRNELPYAVCPLDYFPKLLSEQLKGKLGGLSDGARTNDFVKSPTCGKVIHDIAGSVKGNWFLSGIDSSRINDPPNLALVQGHIDQSLQYFSNGESTKKSNLDFALYYFEPQNSGFINRDFAQVKSDGNIYCYETKNSYKNSELTAIIIQLTDPQRLMIQGLGSSNCGSGPWHMTNYTEFER